MKDKINETIKNLKINRMSGYHVKTKLGLIKLLKELIQENSSVGCGDSVTLEQLEIFNFLEDGNYDFNNKHQEGLSKSEKRNIYLKNFDVDTFITGSNAITIDGKIFNIDGNGSRVAPMLYGPRQVIIVVSANKICLDVEHAIERTRQIAAVKDAIRLNKDTPCTKLNKCIDCNHPHRICNDFVLISNQFDKNRIKVIIIDGEYGY